MRTYDLIFHGANKESSSRAAAIIALEMQQRGFSVLVMAEGMNNMRFLQDQGVKHVVDLLSMQGPSCHGSDDQPTESVWDELGIHDPSSFVFPSVANTGMPEAEVTHLATRYLSGIKDFMERNVRGCVYVANPGGDLMKRCALHAVSPYCREVRIVMPSPFPDRFAFIMGECDRWLGLNYSPDSLQSSAATQHAQEYMATLKQSRRVIGGPIPLGSDLSNRLGSTVALVKMSFKRKRLYNTETAIRVPLIRPFRKELGRYLRAVYYRKYYQQPDLQAPYVFFPLQFPAESQLSVLGFRYYQQETVVETLARFLPEGYSLYVKEHPRHLGVTPLHSIRRIASLSNVILVPPMFNTHELIENSRAVAVINSTVGFESLIYGKSVVAFARPFYTGFGLTYDVSEADDLGAVLLEATQTGQDEETILQFVAATWAATRTGALLSVQDPVSEPERQLLFQFCDSLEPELQSPA